jgi:hypothetical protein
MAWTTPGLMQATVHVVTVIGNVRFEAVMAIAMEIADCLIKGTNCLINRMGLRNAYRI